MHETQIRADLERIFPDLTDGEWQWLMAKNYVADCLEDIALSVPDAINKLADEIRMLPSRSGDPANAPRMLEAARAPVRDRRAATSRTEALSVLIAQDAAQEPDVQAFRHDVLQDRLLELEDVEAWIKEQSEKQGPPSFWLSSPLAIPEGTRIHRDGAVLTFDPPLVIARLDRRQSQSTSPLKREMLEYGVPGKDWTLVVLVRSGGVLDSLRCLSEDCARSYGWQLAQATLFILTGKVPLVHAIWTETSLRSPLSATSRITLKVDPMVTPQEVADEYRRLRREMIPGRARPLSEKHAQLALFTAQRPDGEPWAARMGSWNDRNPQWHYGQVSNFTRDARRAQQQLLQPRL